MAVDAADVCLMTDDVALLPEAIELGRRCTRLVKQNIALAVGIKLLVVGCALRYNLALWVAVLADLGSLLLVVANGARPLMVAGAAAVVAPPAEPATLYQATLPAQPAAAAGVSFVVYYAAWSKPSLAAKAALEQAARQGGGAVRAVDVDDDSDDEAERGGVAEVPTVLRLRDNAVAAKLAGAACSTGAIGALVAGH